MQASNLSRLGRTVATTSCLAVPQLALHATVLQLFHTYLHFTPSPPVNDWFSFAALSLFAFEHVTSSSLSGSPLKPHCAEDV